MTQILILKSVTEISKSATAIIRDMEKTGNKIVIVRYGKPVAVLKKATRNDKGREINVSHFRNEALSVLAEIEKTGKPLIITREGKPVAFLQRATETLSY